VEIKINGKMIQYYKAKGYDAKYQQVLTVKIEDLQQNSHAMVDVLCDGCKDQIINMTYESYNKRMSDDGFVMCKKCGYIRRVNTCNQKYGVDNPAKTKECQDKMKSTMKKLYGVEHALQCDVFKESFKNTCEDRYGKDYAKQFAEKAAESFYSKTGYHFSSQSPDVREKITQAYIDKLGVDNPAKSSEVREKITQTLYANLSQKVSKQQRYINTLYNGTLNYPVKYYNVDIYLPEDNLIVEYDGGGHILNVITGRETQEEFNQKEIIRNNIIKREGYKQMRIISTKDLLPSDTTLLLMLEQAREYFSQNPERSWIEFNIDEQTMFNADHKSGIFFDYGELRRIRQEEKEKESEEVA
jgi:very-short-patch-repair endonuclease